MLQTPGGRLAARGIAGLAIVGSLVVVACATATPPRGVPSEGAGPTPSTEPDRPATTRPGTRLLPDRFAAVGEDGVLAMVATATGERLDELAEAAPRARARGRETIGGVTVGSDGQHAWFDIRRPGSPGRIYQVPTDGSAPPTQVATGTFPEVDPAGGRLAFVEQGAVVVHGIVTDEEERWPVTGRVTDLAWTTNGTGLMWVRDGRDLVWLDRDNGAEPEVVASVEAPDTMHLPLGTFPGLTTVIITTGRHDPTPERLIVTGDGSPGPREPDGLNGARDRSCEPTGDWCIRVTGDGTVRWSGSGGLGTITRGYVAADW